MAKGPLSGLRILEFAGIGPAPFCGMLLSDLGADVVRVDREDADVGVAAMGDRRFAVTDRGRRSIALDLKSPGAVETCLRLGEKADALIEGFRPGVMERLGLGPEPMLGRNPALVYGRMTGWGQSGPLAGTAGHDVDYIAISGVLAAIGGDDKPSVPLNLIGDFGGGGLYLAFGLLAGILHARETGHGQVVDCAMSDGAASLMSMFYGLRAMGQWSDGRRSNLLDGGAPFYDTYRCADGKWLAVGALEPRFHGQLLDRLGLDPAAFERRMDPASWPDHRARIAAAIACRPRSEWIAIFDGSDACVAPVLAMGEAPEHPHNIARETFVELQGVVQPAPAPRFSRTPGEVQRPPPARGAHSREILADWGLGDVAPADPHRD